MSEILFNANFLLAAIKSDDLQTLKHFSVSNDFSELDFFLQQKFNSSIIHLCVQYDSFKICQYILSVLPTAIDLRNYEGKKPIHVACIFNSFKCLKILISQGANVNDYKRGDWTPLMIATSKANIDFVHYLLENGAIITMRNKDAWNALHLACRIGEENLICCFNAFLEKYNQTELWYSKTNTQRTVMHITAIHGHFQLFNWIIDHLNVFKLNVKDNCGVTPFMDAARANCVKICQQIHEKFAADLNQHQRDNLQRTALHMSSQTNSCDALKYLSCTLNSDLDSQDVWGQTALFLAVSEGHIEATKLLIELGANKSLTDYKNRNVIDLCSIYKREHLIPLFK